jgi:hypothetical protein
MCYHINSYATNQRQAFATQRQEGYRHGSEASAAIPSISSVATTARQLLEKGHILSKPTFVQQAGQITSQESSL